MYDFSARALDALLPQGARLLDLGVGSGRALGALLRRRPDVQATAVDLAPNMLATARDLFVAERLDNRVELVEADITALPDRLVTANWDGVSCVWTLHQLPDYDVLRAAIRQIVALRRKSGAAVWIFDFQRLNDPTAFAALLSCVDASIPPVLQKDAFASEAAAFTHAELKAELTAAGLDNMRAGHARPLPYVQAHWVPATSVDLDRSVQNQGKPLHGRAGRDAALLRWGFTGKPF
ncbi:MAG TPA: methyltransferase domain-containing protein [Mycobacterium sp.]